MIDTESVHNIYPNMAKQQYHHRPQFGDTTFTKLFVGGLAWETPPEEMRKYFEQFGDILEAVIITDKNTGKSKGYGFVTFSDEESARRACDDPNPVIDGRKANCNIASLGRTRPSPPRGGRAQGGGVLFPGAGPPSVALAQPPPLLYHHPSSYGYQTYTPGYAYHHQGTMYNPVQVQVQQAQYYQQQVYGTSSSSSCNSSPYYYVQEAPRSAYSYIYYPTTPMDVSFSGYPPPMRQQLFPSPTPTDSQVQATSSESKGRVVISSESLNSEGKN